MWCKWNTMQITIMLKVVLSGEAKYLVSANKLLGNKNVVQ
jgi:hypothetical protein